MTRPTHRPIPRPPIHLVATALGLRVERDAVPCFNDAQHRGGRDDHPSLRLYADSNRFYCFPCGIKGDVIDLVRGVRACSFQDALAWLSQLPAPAVEAGGRGFSPVVSQSPVPSEEDRQVYDRLINHCVQPIAGSPSGFFLDRRGIDLEVSRDCGVGEILDARDVWEKLVHEFGQERLTQAGLVSRKGKFLFSMHRLLLVYFDDAEPLFIQARDVSGSSGIKELSLGNRLHSPIPYNFNALRDEPEHVVVCEGGLDTLSAVQLGYAAVGVPGVMGFRDEWFEYFGGVKRITIAFDNDLAGHRQGKELRAAFRMRGFSADFRPPANGKDINDLLLQLAKERVL